MKDQNNSFYWCVFSNDQLLIEKRAEGEFTLPQSVHPPVRVRQDIFGFTFGDGMICKVAEAEEDITEGSGPYSLIDLRASWEVLSIDMFNMAGKAAQILYWDKHSRFCPVCGTATQLALPNMKQCPNCRFELYPPISTAILVLIRKEESILLVRAHNFRGPFHGLVAGFLEPGETLEECVIREVKEETGLNIRNLSYFGNQPWPFPSGLMVGFIADYDGGELNLQEEELSHAAFYTRENLPELPRRLSLARKMIDWWLENPSSASI